ncbi:MAG: 7-cyano-7-deazaguanine synthase [Planctomycetes bacterium]|nr:7-cyano-7-deazaguanine synthase [Planctomycetota bacterium]
MGGGVAVVSGGLDSVTALHLYARHNRDSSVLALTFDYGQPAARMEISAAAYFARALGFTHDVIALPWMSVLVPPALNAEESSDTAVWVPNRNGVFVAAAAAIAESMHRSDVIMGFNSDESVSFPDGSPAFMDATNRSLGYSTQSAVSVVSPTLELTKQQLAAMLDDLRIDSTRLWSCYGPGPAHCGQCPSCKRLFDALAAAAVPEAKWPERNRHGR